MAKRKPLKELPAEFSEHKFERLTESSKVSNFSKEEFEAYQKMYHKEWDHNAMANVNAKWRRLCVITVILLKRLLQYPAFPWKRLPNCSC